MNYNITISEDRSGNLSVTHVDKIMKINQYRHDTQSLPCSTFSVSRLTKNPKVKTAKRKAKTSK